jgi:hypothetical protein
MTAMSTDELLAEARRLTEAMERSRAEQADLAAVRREVLFTLNREHHVTYRALHEATGLACSRLIEEIRRHREATGAARLPSRRARA